MNPTTGLDDPKVFLEGDYALPPLPAVVEKLLRTLQSGRANAGEIAEILSADAGLVTQIMAIVNSAYYGLPSAIRDVRHAVAYLGLGEIKRVAMTAAIMERLAPQDTTQFERFWYHSFHTSLSARALARSFGADAEIDELHVSALLHDIGKLAYMRFFADAYQRLESVRRDEGLFLYEAEERLGLPSHTLLGARLCERWALPDTVRRACLEHELPDLRQINTGRRASTENRLICVANLLSNLSLEELDEEHKQQIRDETMTALGCSEPEFLLVMGELYELKSEVQSFLRKL